jgi:hypothetical protein
VHPPSLPAPPQPSVQLSRIGQTAGAPRRYVPVSGRISFWDNPLRGSGTERVGEHNFHNHPSGLASASTADELITRRLRDALALIDVRVLDHLIVAESIFSFAEAGLL